MFTVMFNNCYKKISYNVRSDIVFPTYIQPTLKDKNKTPIEFKYFICFSLMQFHNQVI